MPSLKYCTCTILTAMRHIIMQTIRACRICTIPTTCAICMVSINETHEWIVLQTQRVTGEHVSPPLR